MTKSITKSRTVKSPMPKITTDIGEIKKPDWIPAPDVIKIEIEHRKDSVSIWTIIWWLVKRPIKIIRLIYSIVKLIDKVQRMAKDKSKTTTMATVKVVLGIIATIVGIFGIGLPEGFQEAVLSIAAGGYFLFSWIQGFFTKDDTKDAE